MVVKIKMVDTSLISRVKTTAATRRNNSKKHSKKLKEDNSEGGNICYLENICGAGQTQMHTIQDEFNIDAGKHVLVMFLN